MGQYVITVIGQGPHHNSPENSGSDADRVASRLVQELKDRGHQIYDASFVAVAGEGQRSSLEHPDTP
jgi:hypothetical protein